MDFVANSEEQCAAMLAAIGVANIEELFDAIPRQLWREPLVSDDGLSESEGQQLMEEIAAENTYTSYDAYLGAGAYQHHVPACVGAICSKSEFMTAYTPYQAEASQGLLQATFEFQSAICALTGLDVANASLYDGASACAEAALMALRLRPGRRVLLVAETLHPHYRAVVDQYVMSTGALVVSLPAAEDGLISESAVAELLTDEVAAVLLQSPNFWGLIEEGAAIFRRVREAGALSLLCANPLAYGFFASAQEQQADIAMGDCQPLGLGLNFGGPYVGYLACQREFVRQLPGRLVGVTLDKDGKEGFVLTLQAREQHIRREKASSNICTNQALAALGSLVATLWYGAKGLEELALTNYQRAAYLRQQLKGIEGIDLLESDHYFNEFIVSFKQPLDKVYAHFRQAGILPGIPLGRWYKRWQNALLVCVTEAKTLQQLDRYVQVAAKISCREGNR